MAFAFILPSSRPRLHARATDQDAAQSSRIAAELRSDYERWSRWTLGLVAFLVAAIGVFVVGGMLDAIAALDGAVAPVDLIVIALATALTIAASWALVKLWRTGRALTIAAAAWLRAPFAGGARARRSGGWVHARTVNFEPPIFARLATAALALLLAVSGIAVLVRNLVEGGFGGFSAAAGLIGLLALACGVGQAGGVIRIVSGVSEGDPLWARMRSAREGS